MLVQNVQHFLNGTDINVHVWMVILILDRAVFQFVDLIKFGAMENVINKIQYIALQIQLGIKKNLHVSVLTQTSISLTMLANLVDNIKVGTDKTVSVIHHTI